MRKLLQSIKRAQKNQAFHSVQAVKVSDTFSNTDITKSQSGFNYPSPIFTLK